MRETNNLAIAGPRVVLMVACKAGNTSIKQALHDAGYARPNPRGRYFGFEHWTAEECARSGFHRVAILRNPAERLLSTWWAKIVIGDRKVDMLERHAGAIWPGMQWSDFVEAVFRIPDRSADPHLRSQCFDRFHRGLYLPKKVFKLENPAENWWPALRSFLPRLPAAMPFENARSDRPALADVSTKGDLDRIATRYHADFLLGGYPLPKLGGNP